MTIVSIPKKCEKCGQPGWTNRQCQNSACGQMIGWGKK